MLKSDRQGGRDKREGVKVKVLSKVQRREITISGFTMHGRDGKMKENDWFMSFHSCLVHRYDALLVLRIEKPRIGKKCFWKEISGVQSKVGKTGGRRTPFILDTRVCRILSHVILDRCRKFGTVQLMSLSQLLLESWINKMHCIDFNSASHFIKYGWI